MLHQDLTQKKWETFSFIDQMANVGAEVGRAMNWRGKNVFKSQAAFERSLELLDLTIADPKNHGSSLKELCRVKEALVDYFMGENMYGSNDASWNNYFYSFNYASAIQHGR